jgi:mono/diheme cytochrome c family protein
MMTGMRMPAFSILAVCCLCVTRLAAAQPFAAALLDDYTGAELYQQFCASCHGESAHGDGPVAASLSHVVPDLTRISARRGGVFPEGEIAAMIDGRSLIVTAHGTREMPVWGYEFWVEEGADIEAEAEARALIRRLTEYLKTIQTDVEER